MPCFGELPTELPKREGVFGYPYSGLRHVSLQNAQWYTKGTTGGKGHELVNRDLKITVKVFFWA